MKTKTLDVARRGAVSARCVPFVAAVSLSLFAGCVTDEPATASAAQSLGSSCTILRPFAWSGPGASCAEGGTRSSITLLNGDSVTFFAASLPGHGVGEVTIICNNGAPVPDPWDDICIPNRGGGGQEP